MKVSELVGILLSKLRQYGDREVEITWEGTWNTLDRRDIYLSKDGILLLDADNCSYKKDYAANPMEGESQTQEQP